MPIKDNRSDTRVVMLLNTGFGGDATSFSNSIDTFDFDNGITFIPKVVANAGVTIATITDIQESDTDSEPAFQSVSSDKLIGNLSDLTFSNPIIPQGINETIGVVGTKRFLRLEITISNHNGTLELIINFNAGVEVAPAE